MWFLLWPWWVLCRFWRTDEERELDALAEALVAEWEASEGTPGYRNDCGHLDV